MSLRNAPTWVWVVAILVVASIVWRVLQMVWTLAVFAGVIAAVIWFARKRE